MSPGQYTLAGLAVAQLVPIIQWVSRWPLQPPSDEQAAAIAGLIVMAVGSIHMAIQSYRGTNVK